MLTVLLPENEYSGPLRHLLAAHLPDGSELRDPDRGLEGLAGRRLLCQPILSKGAGCRYSYGYYDEQGLGRYRQELAEKSACSRFSGIFHYRCTCNIQDLVQ